MTGHDEFMRLLHSCCCATAMTGDEFLQIAGATGLALALPFPALAATGNYEAMVLSCIDPRFPELTRAYTASRGLTGKFSQFVFAGAAIGVVAPAFKDWHKTFWDNLARLDPAAQHPEGHCHRPSRLWRRTNSLWRGGGRQSRGRDRDPSQGPGGIPHAGRCAPSRRSRSRPA